jgi:hypothetical protein
MRPIRIAFLILCFTLPSWTVSAQPKISWQRCLGGSGQDAANCIIQTSDGGYVVAGSAESYDGNITGYNGSNSASVVKLDAQGDIAWQNRLAVNSIIETSDGGIIATGSTSDSTIPGYHGGIDALIVKLSESGAIEWQKCIGGSKDDGAGRMCRTPDGGYVFEGYAESNDGDLTGCPGAGPIWLFKINDSGSILWQRRVEGNWPVGLQSFVSCSSGGFAMAGECNDTGVSSSYYSGEDAWIAKLDDTGAIVWQQLIRSGADYEAYSITSSTDSGLVVAVNSWLNFDMLDTTHTVPLGASIWLVKFNDSGTIVWQRYLSNSDTNVFAESITNTSDGGFVVAGVIDNVNTESDAYVIKLNDTGGVEWEQYYGGSREETAASISQTRDGGFIFAGWTNSHDGEVSGWHGDSSSVYDDIWVVKLGGTDAVQPSISSSDPLAIRCYPNPANSEAVLSFNLPQSSEVSISILDALGRTVHIIPSQEMDAGAHCISLDAEHWTNGVYECRIDVGSESAVSKLVVVR